MINHFGDIYDGFIHTTGSKRAKKMCDSLIYWQNKWFRFDLGSQKQNNFYLISIGTMNSNSTIRKNKFKPSGSICDTTPIWLKLSIESKETKLRFKQPSIDVSFIACQISVKYAESMRKLFIWRMFWQPIRIIKVKTKQGKIHRKQRYRMWALCRQIVAY